MPLDPSTLCARTAAGDAELAAPRHGLAIAQRRLLTLLDQPLALDDLAARPGLQPDRLERDLGRLVDNGLVEIHRPAGAIGPTFPAHRRSPAAVVLPPPVTVSPAEPARAASLPTTPVRRVRRGRALFVGFASLVAVGAVIWYVSAPSPGPPRRTPQGSVPPADAVPVAVRSAGATSFATPSKSLEPVRAVIDMPAESSRAAVALPAPSREPVAGPPVATVPATSPQARVGEPATALTTRPASVVAPSVAVRHDTDASEAVAPSPAPVVSSPAAAGASAGSPPLPSPLAQTAVASAASAAAAPAPAAPPIQLAAATTTSLDARMPSRALVPLMRESPEFPREALNAGVRQGTVKARLSVDEAGRVTGVDILDAQPRRVFDRAVTRTLARWTFEPGASGRTTDVEVVFQRE
jgi:protein TonB